jgi:hypothetical protein
MLPSSHIDYYNEWLAGQESLTEEYCEVVGNVGERMTKESRAAFFKVFSDHQMVQN